VSLFLGPDVVKEYSVFVLILEGEGEGAVIHRKLGFVFIDRARCVTQ
jgi:hypothetical protein